MCVAIIKNQVLLLREAQHCVADCASGCGRMLSIADLQTAFLLGHKICSAPCSVEYLKRRFAIIKGR